MRPKNESILKYLMLRLAHPQFFKSKPFLEEKLFCQIGGSYSDSKGRIWKIAGNELNAFVLDVGNSWIKLIRLTNKEGKILWQSQNDSWKFYLTHT